MSNSSLSLTDLPTKAIKLATIASTMLLVSIPLSFAEEPKSANPREATTSEEKLKFGNINAKLMKALERIEKLETDLAPFRSAKGAVVAFDRNSQEASACPPGWSIFKPAGGRFVVGAGFHGNGLSEYKSYSENSAKAVGGEEKHTLTVNELPPHKHAGTTDIANPAPLFRIVSATRPIFSTASSDLNFATNHATGWKAGGVHEDFRNMVPPGGDHTHNFVTNDGIGLNSKPHNNLPPFIALYYCKKD